MFVRSQSFLFLVSRDRNEGLFSPGRVRGVKVERRGRGEDPVKRVGIMIGEHRVDLSGPIPQRLVLSYSRPDHLGSSTSSDTSVLRPDFPGKCDSTLTYRGG